MLTPAAPLLAKIDLLTPLTSPQGLLVGDILLVVLTLAQVACVTALVVGAARLHLDDKPTLAVKRSKP